MLKSKLDDQSDECCFSSSPITIRVITNIATATIATTHTSLLSSSTSSSQFVTPPQSTHSRLDNNNHNISPIPLVSDLACSDADLQSCHEHEGQSLPNSSSSPSRYIVGPINFHSPPSLHTDDFKLEPALTTTDELDCCYNSTSRLTVRACSLLDGCWMIEQVIERLKAKIEWFQSIQADYELEGSIINDCGVLVKRRLTASTDGRKCESESMR